MPAKRKKASSKISAKKRITKKQSKKDFLDFFVAKAKDNSNHIRNTAKVGVVVALVGGIFKAIALTETFPQPFDKFANVILFIAFLIMLAAFLLGRY